MNINKSLIVMSIFFLFTGLLYAQQGGGVRGKPLSRSSKAGSSGSLISETVISVRANSISVAGRLEPESRIIHKSSVSGYIGELYVNIGDFVQTGDHLFRIDRIEVGQSFKPVYVDSRITGIVSEINIQIYSDTSAGSPAVTIISKDGYLVEAVISDKDAFKINIGQTVIGNNPDGLSVSGTLIGRSQEPDYNTGLFSLSFKFPKKSGFYIGSFILINLPTDQKKGIFINRDLLVRKYGKYFLWLVNDEDKITAREVETGAVFGDDIHIVSGLVPGERYLSVITGKETEGMVIKRGNN